jgi:hypothetical protein
MVKSMVVKAGNGVIEYNYIRVVMPSRRSDGVLGSKRSIEVQHPRSSHFEDSSSCSVAQDSPLGSGNL